MISYKIIPSTELINTSNKNYRIKQLDEIKESLDAAKSQLDESFKNPQFGKYWRECDPFKNEKGIVAKLGNTYNVSNAWIKCYEILIHFKLLPDVVDGEFIHFDNAAFPGSFIISTHHLVKTQYKWHASYKWYGSSLLGENDNFNISFNLNDNFNISFNLNDNILSISNLKKLTY